MKRRKIQLEAFNQLLDIMDELREKCPWDKKQTFESLTHLTIEEVYELKEAIVDAEDDEIKKELGDLMMHMVFYAKIASENNKFDIADVLLSINAKLIERHPHIYGDVKAESDEEVAKNWELIKLKTGNKSVLSGVPKTLPALTKAMRIQEKVKGVGFDWENKEQVWEKVNEEISELQYEIANANTEEMINEMGDVLFSLVNYSRFINVNPEEALERTNKKFIARFQKMEVYIKNDGKQIDQLSFEELDSYWEKAKKNLS